MKTKLPDIRKNFGTLRIKHKRQGGNMDIKRLTDDREVLIKALEEQYLDVEVPKEVKPSKYDEGTGTYYADEELARKKLETKNIPLDKKVEEPVKTLDEMLALFVNNKEEEVVVKKRGTAAVKESDGSKWHTGNR